MSKAEYDAILVGAGLNGLIAAVVLVKAGWRVCVLERNDYLGGAIRTAQITEHGFQHELFSGVHSMFVASKAYAALKADLTTRGLQYTNTTQPTAALFPNGTSIHLSTSHKENIVEFERHAAGDGEAWSQARNTLLADLGLTAALRETDLASLSALKLVSQLHRRKGTQGTLGFLAHLLSTARVTLTRNFSSELLRGLLAPWVLHIGIGPEDQSSGYAAMLLGVLQEEYGAPMVKGGSSRLVEALVSIIIEQGGLCETSADVERILVSNGCALGVQLTTGTCLTAARAVICSVTPTQLYFRLLDRSVVPPDLLQRAGHYRYGYSAMQIHMALSEKPCWQGDKRLLQTAFLNVTRGLDAVSREVNEAQRGLLPAEPTIGCGQPIALDSSRGPDGSWIFWIQILALPAHPKGDAAGELDTGNGTWNESLRERYADRIQRQLAAHIPNLESALLKRVVQSPADLARANINLVGGHLNAGAMEVDQMLLGRPFSGYPSHRTPIKGLYHIGASTLPGPGLNAGSGWIVSQELLRMASLRKKFFFLGL